MDPNEYKIYQTGKAQGKDDAFIKGAIQAYRQTKSPAAPAPAPTNEPHLSPFQAALRGIDNAASGVVNTLGFAKTANTIGSAIAHATASPETKPLLPAPSLRDTAGAALNVGSLLVPIGATERVGAGLAAKVVGRRVAAVAGKIGAGLAVGATNDIGHNLEDGRAALMPGVGTALGVAGPLVAAGGKAVMGAAKSQAPNLINSLIKPLSKGFSYGKDPGRAVSELGITGNSLEDLAKNITSARASIGQSLETVAARVPIRATTNLSDAISPFDEAIKTAVTKNDQALYNRLQEARDAITHIFTTSTGKIVKSGSRLLDDLNYAQGVEVKRIIGDLAKWTGAHTEDTTVNGALTRSYGVVKDKLSKLAEEAAPELAPQLKKLNEQYADLTSAEIAAKYRDVLDKRQNLVNLPGKIGLGLSLIAAPFTGGLSTVLAGISSIGIDKALSSTAFKTRLAAWLAKAPAAEKAALIGKYPQLKTFNSPGDILLNAGSKHLKANPPSLGLSAKAVTKDTVSAVTADNVAKRMDDTDFSILQSYLKRPSDLNLHMKAQPLLDAMGISKLSAADEARFLKEVVALYEKASTVTVKAKDLYKPK